MRFSCRDRTAPVLEIPEVYAPNKRSGRTDLVKDPKEFLSRRMQYDDDVLARFDFHSIIITELILDVKSCGLFLLQTEHAAIELSESTENFSSFFFVLKYLKIKVQI